MPTDNYDLLITLPGENPVTVPLVLDWGVEEPWGRDKSTPNLQPGAAPTGASNVFSARDTDPPYPLETTDWRAGAGQKMREGEKSRPNAFFASKSMDVTTEGEITLGPKRLLLSLDTTATVGKVGANAMPTFDNIWAGFTKNSADADRLRRLKHTSLAQAGSMNPRLGGTTDNAIEFASGYAGITAYSYLVCREHGEVVMPTTDTFRNTPSYRGTNRLLATGAGPHNVTLPTGSVAGDLGLLCFGIRKGGGSLSSVGNSWTQVIADTTSSADMNLYLYKKTLDATDITNGYVAVTVSASVSIAAQTVSYNGTQAHEVHASAVSAAVYKSTSGTVTATPPSFTIIPHEVVRFVTVSACSNNGSALFSNWSLTHSPYGASVPTERTDYQPNGANPIMGVGLATSGVTGGSIQYGSYTAGSVDNSQVGYYAVIDVIVDKTTKNSATLYCLRGQCGTDPVAHNVGDHWDLYQWENSAWSATAAAYGVRGLTTDGYWIYASFHDDGSSNGKVCRGTAAGTETADWVDYSSTNDIIDLEYCNGIVYGVQAADAASPPTLNIGYFGAGTLPVTFVTIPGDTVLTPYSEHVGLAAMDNHVYWVINGARGGSFVYKVLHGADGDTRQMVAQLPRDFHATCVEASQGIVYVGGWRDTGIPYSNNYTTTIKEGTVFAIVDGANIVRLCTINFHEEVDYSVLALSAGNRFVDILTKQAVWRYDLDVGGFHHLHDVPTTTGSQAGTSSFTASGESYYSYGQVYPNAASHPNDFSREASGGAGEVRSFVTQSPFGYMLRTGCNDKNEYVTYYKTDSGLGTAFTFYAMLANCKSQGAHIYVNGSEKMARIRVLGVMSGPTLVNMQVFVNTTGSTWQLAGAVPGDDFLYIWAMCDTTSGLRVYVNGVLGVTAAYADLPNTSGGQTYTNTSRVCFGCGWPGYGAATDTTHEQAQFGFVQWDASKSVGFWEYSGTSVTAPKSVMSLNGELMMAMPDSYLCVLSPRMQAQEGYIISSEATVQQGSKQKRFQSIDITHEALQTGQTIEVNAIVDNNTGSSTYITGPSPSGSSLVTSTIPVNLSGQKIAVKLTLTDTAQTRSPATKLRIYAVTAFFTIQPTNARRTFVADLSGRTALRSGRPYDQDSQWVIEQLYSMVGSYVTVKSLQGDFNAYVESIKGVGSPNAMQAQDRERGRLLVTLVEQ